MEALPSRLVVVRTAAERIACATLGWTRSQARIVVDFTGRRPMLRIPAESEKGGKDRLLPMAPEFADFLQRSPTPSGMAACSS